jgi:UDPglucose--hexose-1-phosphate uridylyltransferase
MSQLRFDHTTSDWVVFAPLRKLRPHHEAVRESASAKAAQDAIASCPFCPGNELLTPPEIDAVRTDPENEASWQVRVVSNKFPVLTIEESHDRHQVGRMFQQMGGCGAHEVVIESPEHECFLGQLPGEHIEVILRMIRARYKDLKRDRRFQSIIIFKNHGVGAGTSLRHPHWQIIATPVVPRLSRLKYAEATEYFDRTGTCLYCDLLHDELTAKKRVVAADDEFVAIIPYASHLAFETWIFPRRQQTTLDALQDKQLRPLAEMLKTVLLKLYVGLDNPDFNLTIEMAPRGDEDKEYFHWHIRILPRLTTPAGFELGSGMSINTVFPEEAAAFLRDGDSK